MPYSRTKKKGKTRHVAINKDYGTPHSRAAAQWKTRINEPWKERAHWAVYTKGSPQGSNGGYRDIQWDFLYDMRKNGPTRT